jgi:hypothetical protein
LPFQSGRIVTAPLIAFVERAAGTYFSGKAACGVASPDALKNPDEAELAPSLPGIIPP